MLKKILELKGTTELSREEQKSISGGNAPVCESGMAKHCPRTATEPAYWICVSSINDTCD